MKVNENLAREAKRANSFNDYKEGSETESYKGYISRFQNAVDILKTRHAESYKKNQEAVEYWCDRYAAKLAWAINRKNQIASYCPSIMICGGGNFPVRKKEKQNDMNFKFWNECGDLFNEENYYYKKIDTILSNKVIYSNDELVIEKLQDKLKELQELQEEMKIANAYYRKNKTMKDFEELTDEKAEKWDKAILESWDKKPYATFELSNNSGNIKNVIDRIARLEKLKQVETEYLAVEGIEVKENKEIMRIQLFFDGKPSEEIRDLLKSNGFNWSPREKAWQRQLTENGIRATKKVLDLLN